MTSLLSGVLLAISFVRFAASPLEPYAAAVHGVVAGYRLSGVEPDGDPLYQAVMKTDLAPSGKLPRLNLIVDAYMEQFKPDTTPILPDFLHRNRPATNLGGFLQGKLLLTDDAGNVISIGSFVAEAFLDNSNSAIMTLYGSKSGYGAAGQIQGRFNLAKQGQNVAVTGRFTGHLSLSASARRQVLANAGKRMKPVEKIISQVSVTPHAMVGRATAKSQSVPLHTGFSGTQNKSPLRTPAAPSTSGKPVSAVTIAAAAGAILSFLIAALLLWRGRKQSLTT
jgi:hypothetical protein